MRSRGLGDVYKRQAGKLRRVPGLGQRIFNKSAMWFFRFRNAELALRNCLLYTSDAADERSSVDLGGRRIIKKKTITRLWHGTTIIHLNTTDNSSNNAQPQINKRQTQQT